MQVHIPACKALDSSKGADVVYCVNIELDNIVSGIEEAIDNGEHQCSIEIGTHYGQLDVKTADLQRDVMYYVLVSLENAGYIVELEYNRNRKGRLIPWVNIRWKTNEDIKEDKYKESYLATKMKTLRVAHK